MGSISLCTTFPKHCQNLQCRKIKKNGLNGFIFMSNLHYAKKHIFQNCLWLSFWLKLLNEEMCVYLLAEAIMESKALELASRVFPGAAFTSKNRREKAYKHHVCIPPAFVLEFKDSDLMIQWSMVHWTMIKLINVHYVTIKVTMILYFIQKGTGEDMLRTCVWSTAAGIKKTNTQ